MGIRVRAKMLGYYDHLRRREGEEFIIASESQFSNRWMERLDAAPEAVMPNAKRSEEPESEGGFFNKKKKKKYEEPVMVVKDEEEEDTGRDSDENVL